jgi:hypothetical protein
MANTVLPCHCQHVTFGVLLPAAPRGIRLDAKLRSDPFLASPCAPAARLYQTLRGSTRLNIYTATEETLRTATHVALELDRQKNGVRGELVGLGHSGHPLWYPMITMIHRVLSLRSNHASPFTPLHQYYENHKWRCITTTMLTKTLCRSALQLGAASGISANDISIQSLRSSGAMALLCAAMDPDIICLLGRWHSDEMLRYLHVQALPIVAPLATSMVQCGDFAFLPNSSTFSMGNGGAH